MNDIDQPSVTAPLLNALSAPIVELVAKGGPSPNDYAALDAWFEEAHRVISTGIIASDDKYRLRRSFGDAMRRETMQGFVCEQPHGYPGDYEIIDRIYQHHLSPSPSLAQWDQYFHQHAAPIAVRNRKEHFKEVCHAAWQTTHGQTPIRVLILGSGPAREVQEYLTISANARVTFDCIDLDSKAIKYASNLNRKFSNKVRFHHGNAIRFRASESYDLIWSAGLFDYFSDDVFVRLIRRYVRMLAAGGELVIGNFSTDNPSRAYMEFGNWYLNHRSANDLRTMAALAGIHEDRVEVRSEPLGVNLFLHIKSGR